MLRTLARRAATVILPTLMTSCLTIGMWQETLDLPDVPRHYLEFEVDTIATLRTEPGEAAELHVELPLDDGTTRTWFRLTQAGGSAHLDAILAQPDLRDARWQIVIDPDEHAAPQTATITIGGVFEHGVGRLESTPARGVSTAASIPLHRLRDHPWLRWLGVDKPTAAIEVLGWVHRSSPVVDESVLLAAFDQADFPTLRDHELVVRFATPDEPPVEARLRADAIWLAEHGSIRTNAKGETEWLHRTTWGRDGRHRPSETRYAITTAKLTGIPLRVEGYLAPSIGDRVATAALLTPLTLAADLILGPGANISRPWLGLKERPTTTR